MEKNSELIKFIYQNKTDIIDNLIRKANKEIRDELKIINTESVIGNSNNPNEMKKIFDDIEDNYNIKINKYNEEIYKLGFIDGVNLMINCLRNP